jgi:hypothetical protein
VEQDGDGGFVGEVNFEAGRIGTSQGVGLSDLRSWDLRSRDLRYRDLA